MTGAIATNPIRTDRRASGSDRPAARDRPVRPTVPPARWACTKNRRGRAGNAFLRVPARGIASARSVSGRTGTRVAISNGSSETKNEKRKSKQKQVLKKEKVMKKVLGILWWRRSWWRLSRRRRALASSSPAASESSGCVPAAVTMPPFSGTGGSSNGTTTRAAAPPAPAPPPAAARAPARTLPPNSLPRSAPAKQRRSPAVTRTARRKSGGFVLRLAAALSLHRMSRPVGVRRLQPGEPRPTSRLRTPSRSRHHLSERIGDHESNG